jgi:hopanoid biosynthesis associated radical SAM protein HpnH
MLEPLYRCNLACAGCGKIQHPEPILNAMLSPQECFQAAEECGAPVVSVAGGEPLIHPRIDEIVGGLVERRRFVYLCTNAILLEKALPKLRPSPYLTINVHLDGLGQRHDELVGRRGVFDLAVGGIQAAKEAGFRVTTNTTVYAGADPEHLRELFNFLTGLGVDGFMVSPAYDYSTATDQQVFLSRPKMIETFRALFRQADRRRPDGRPRTGARLGSSGRWRFSHTPLFLEFLQGKVPLQCTPWGNPTRSVLGWQRPCYLIDDGFAGSFEELMRDTEWERYGYGRDPRCADCMMHCGYEASALLATTSSPANLLQVARWAAAGL